MKIRRFNESLEDDLRVIKDYFASFTEDLEDICGAHFNKVNDNLFEVVIRFTGEMTSQISDETKLTKLDHWIDMNEVDNKILKELRASMQMLVSDDMLEEFKLTKHTWGYTIEIHTQIKGEVTDWCYVNDSNITYDKNRLKKIIFDKFGVEVESSHMGEEYDKHGDRYLEFGITFKNKIKGEVVKQIKDFILNIEIEVDGDLEKVFTSSWGLWNYKETEEIKNLYFEINSGIIYDVN